MTGHAGPPDCPAQASEEKNAALRRLAPAAEGRCAQRGCRNGASCEDRVPRHVELLRRGRRSAVV
ncbi:DUF6420 family protein [Streptomyces sp. NPDC005573]|uniref:DUF6420 family protein n=1 Tax=Streptomyces sp. NPDC005573 TaxID=3156890 RepID=UPI0033A89A2E